MSPLIIFSLTTVSLLALMVFLIVARQYYFIMLARKMDYALLLKFIEKEKAEGKEIPPYFYKSLNDIKCPLKNPDLTHWIKGIRKSIK